MQDAAAMQMGQGLQHLHDQADSLGQGSRQGICEIGCASAKLHGEVGDALVIEAVVEDADDVGVAQEARV